MVIRCQPRAKYLFVIGLNRARISSGTSISDMLRGPLNRCGTVGGNSPPISRKDEGDCLAVLKLQSLAEEHTRAQKSGAEVYAMLAGSGVLTGVPPISQAKPLCSAVVPAAARWV